MLRKVFARVVERGFRFVTMQTIAERLQAAPPPDDPCPQRLRHPAGGDQDGAGRPRPARRAGDRFESLVCVTAQHRTMLDQVLEVFDLEADVDLDLMVPGRPRPGIAAGILDRLPPLLRRVRPDVVLVQGDTTTTFAAALRRVPRADPDGHVEAGLRTGDRWQPFPEEMNRVLTTRIAALHFAPTPAARDACSPRGSPRRTST